MDRNRTNHRQSSRTLGPHARELTEAELDAVSGGAAATAPHVSEIVVTKLHDCSSTM